MGEVSHISLRTVGPGRAGLISKKDFDLIWDVIKTSFQDDPQTASSRHFYISQWYRDSDAEIRKNSKKTKPRKKDKPEKSRRRGRRGRDSESETSEEEDDDDDEEEKETAPVMNAEVYRLTEARKEYLVSKICPFGPTSKRSTTLASHIDSTAACLIVK